jgi:hypothetical protein
VYKPGAGLGFHFDKDEHLLKSSGQMLHPIWSSILYLTGNSSSSNSSTTTTTTSSSSSNNHHNNYKSVTASSNAGKESMSDTLINDHGSCSWDGSRLGEHPAAI